MTAWWRLVAAREVTTRMRDKSFVIGGVVLVVLVVGGIVVGSVLSGRAASYEVAVTDPAGTSLAATAQEQLRTQSGDPDAEVTATEVADEAAARAAVAAEDLDAALLPTADGFALVGRDEVPSDLSAATTSALSLQSLEENAAQAGTSLEELSAGSVLTEDVTQSGPVAADAAEGVGFVMALLFFVTAIGFGIAIAQSVVVEKENRIVEILAAAVPLRSLLWGKVIGNSVLALAQLLVVAVAAVVTLWVVGESASVPSIGVAGVWFLAFFVVGFLALASLWSVAGSLATRQEDLQSTTVPGQALLLVPYLVAVTGNDAAVEVMSWIPIASSMTMPARVVDGEVDWWQPALALALAALAAALLVRLGARWYERTLLQTSRRTTYRELLRMRG